MPFHTACCLKKRASNNGKAINQGKIKYGLQNLNVTGFEPQKGKKGSEMKGEEGEF